MTAREQRDATKTIVALSGTDTETAIQDLAGLYAGRTWYASRADGDYWYRYVGVGDEQMSIRRSQMRGRLRGDVAVEGEVVVQWIEEGQGRLDIGRHETRMQIGVPALAPTGQRFEFEYENWDQRLVHLDRALVADVASEQYIVDGTLLFDRTTAPAPAAVEHWRRSVAGAVRSLRIDGAESLAWHEAQRDVGRALLGLFRLQADEIPDGYGERRNRHIRAAVEFLHAHASEPLTVLDVGRAADLSVRALQESFQRIFETTPMHYLREIRMRHTHADLLAAEPGSVTVGQVAAQWGFTHMGRFSNAYHRRFGEYPRSTLGR